MQSLKLRDSSFVTKRKKMQMHLEFFFEVLIGL